MTQPTLVDLEATSLDALSSVLPDERFQRFAGTMHRATDELRGHTFWNINSTAEGGGVAEMLATLLPYALNAGWDVRWVVMSGDEDFFAATKGIHNALHGTPPTEEDLWDTARPIYERTTRENTDSLGEMIRPGDVVLIHDPQGAGLVGPLREAGAAVAWQSHVGTDDANGCARRAWDFLRPYVESADRYIFTRESYLWDGLDHGKLRVIPPSIDALSVKNAPLDEGEVGAVLAAAEIIEGADGPARVRRSDGGFAAVERRVTRVGGGGRRPPPPPPHTPIVLQVSRWDRLKDPIGFLRMFAEHLAEQDSAHAVYAGPSTNGVADDPEGAAVLEACAEFWRSLSPGLQERLHLLEIPMEDTDENAAIINALQRRADVVVQKSLEEGFGLTVSEAMWKSRPVVAGRVGGIQDQIEHGRSGVLVDDPYDIASFADAASALLKEPELGRRLGEEAHVRVREHFLGPRQLEQYADLVVELLAERGLTR